MSSMKPGDLIGFISGVRGGYNYSGTKGLFEVTNDQNNDFTVVEETEGKWRYVLLPPNYSPEYDGPKRRINLVILSAEDKFICMDVKFNPKTQSFWCVLLDVEQGVCVFSPRTNKLYEVIAEGNPKERL